MDSNAKIKNWDEMILPFQLDKANIRGRITHLDAVLNNVLHQHDYPLEVSALVAEAATLTALIGQTLKLRWKLSLQIRGNGPIRIIATDYFAPTNDGKPARIRAYASFDKKRLEQTTNGTAFDKIGSGMFALLIDQGAGMIPFQGITPLAGGSLAKCAETYFAQSEQLATRFEITISEYLVKKEPHWRAGGIMIQHIPDASPLMKNSPTSKNNMLQNSNNHAENWKRANILLDTVKESELIGPKITPPELLHRLFHEEEPRIFPAQSVEFGCTCGSEKLRQTMSIYSVKDIKTMTAENGMVTADCQFCGAHYELEPDSLGFKATKRKT